MRNHFVMQMITDHYELEDQDEEIHCSMSKDLLGVRSGVLNKGKSQSFSLLRVAVAILFISLQ